jgi:hypothetical protein
MRRSVLAVALLLLIPAVSAQVYKWKDASGTVHYSEAPPPQGTKFEKIHTSGSAEPLAQPAPVAPQEGAMEPAPPPAKVADTPENRAKLCSSLKSNLGALQGSGPVVMEQGGKPQALDNAQRKQQIATAQAQYDQYCKGE